MARRALPPWRQRPPAWWSTYAEATVTGWRASRSRTRRAMSSTAVLPCSTKLASAARMIPFSSKESPSGSSPGGSSCCSMARSREAANSSTNAAWKAATGSFTGREGCRSPAPRRRRNTRRGRCGAAGARRIASQTARSRPKPAGGEAGSTTSAAKIRPPLPRGSCSSAWSRNAHEGRPGSCRAPRPGCPWTAPPGRPRWPATRPHADRAADAFPVGTYAPMGTVMRPAISVMALTT